MTKLTITVDDDLLRSAEAHALELGISLNTFLYEKLVEFASSNDVATARLYVAELARSAESGASGEGRSWAREDIYEARLPK